MKKMTGIILMISGIIIFTAGLMLYMNPKGLSKNEQVAKPFNPDVANALFRSGYIESWGRGISKMTEQCFNFGLPAPLFFFKSSGFWVEFRKDILNAEYLQTLDFNERQIKAVFYVKEKGEITNSIYQEINNTKQTLSSQELAELVEKGILKSSGAKGRGAKYIL